MVSVLYIAVRILWTKSFLYVNYIIRAPSYGTRTYSISISGMMQRFQFGRTVQYRTGIASRTQREQCRAYSTAHCATYRNNVPQHMRVFADRSEREL